ncbi:GyrI-like domain-containing protein [Peribacillus deserti]|uniref:AraC family transcriptional regulator n=1 Tax=Peribacillus deserti TaxID=673318 RepID=A0A2N5M1I2_9BACI|nr:effector binding domain-containing protein [Peribacillus deserti]PLT28209.1 AraC family transcriptional regulator [Peribacillus deserti]
MECKRVRKEFKVVGMRGYGAFSDFQREVPLLAQQFLNRASEISNHTETEISLFEPKREENHLEGHFYAGLLVQKPAIQVPPGMEYIEVSQEFITIRGKITNISSLHTELMKWAVEQGHKRNIESYIIETYHPMENDVEDVEIYLPILS